MANTPLPVQVDYTSRDFASLRDDMLARIKTRIPDWNFNDPSDFGVALVEVFAYMGDLMSYYIDRAANEGSLTTATRRASVVALARDLGYTPSGYAAARVTVVFTNTSGSDVVIPAGTVITATVESGDLLLTIPFETDEDVTIPDSTPTSVTATQGETRHGDSGYGEVLGSSTGSPSQFFEIPDDKVIVEGVQAYVFDGVNYTPWQRVDHLSDYSPLARIYRVLDSGAGVFYVEFGDGTSGLVPSTSHVITAEYRVVDGLNGNVPAGSITEITSVPGLSESEVAVLLGTLTVTNNVPATGGTDPEELESIRFNASQAYRTSARAVSLEDYQNIALTVPTCGKASALSETPGLVTVAVAPYRNTGAAEARPGFEETSPGSGTWDETAELIDLKAAVLTMLDSARMAGTQITTIDPEYTPITIEVTVYATDAIRTTDASTIIRQAILERMDYARAMFGATVYPTDIVALISSLGIASDISVDTLDFAGGGGVGTLSANDYQILLLGEGDLTVTVYGGVEGLSPGGGG